MAKQYDVLFRLLLIGDSGVGKTCLLCRFTDNEFHSSHISTIGVDFKMKTIEVDGIKVRIQIWDTAGQERYQTITKQYYRRAQGIFLVYDISSERSYQHIMKWVSDVDEYAPEGVQKILIGNKADEEQKRQVGREQGQQLAKEYGMDFYETSACTNLNIKESFTRLTELVLQAHRKELDGIRTRASHELALAELAEEEAKPEGTANSSKPAGAEGPARSTRPTQAPSWQEACGQTGVWALPCFSSHLGDPVEYQQLLPPPGPERSCAVISEQPLPQAPPPGAASCSCRPSAGLLCPHTCCGHCLTA